MLSLTREKGRYLREVLLPPNREGLQTTSVFGRLHQAAARVAGGLTS
jgi:hypothetical protein